MARSSTSHRSPVLPPHLAGWQLPPNWRWGSDSLVTDYRHYQEVVDALGRSLSLVSVQDESHADWLTAEARYLAHRSHPAMPTTYHYWALVRDSKRGPGYLRRWISGETIGMRLARQGPDQVPFVLQILREAGSALSYLHDRGEAHGAFSQNTVWLTPSGRIWLLGWQWVVPREMIPPGVQPSSKGVTQPPEWRTGGWTPSPASDQWQLAATCFTILTGEPLPSENIPPITWVRPELPQMVASVIDRALLPDPADRHPSMVAMLRLVDRAAGPRMYMLAGRDERAASAPTESAEARIRWATGDDYEILAPLGRGTFGLVWRARDLSLEREVAMKMLHPHISKDDAAIGRFQREARLAAQLAHPSIVPIYEWDNRGDVSWYTMELAENGSVADLVAREGARPFSEVAPQIDSVLDGLAAAHAVGIIHRDLKPENILIDRYRRWRISDFGIAHAFGEDVGGSSGTPAFAPPEQLLGEPQGPAADVFALAAIVYFVLTSEPPFGEHSGKIILSRQLSGKRALQGFQPELASWLERGLATSPEERFSDANEMRAEWIKVVEIVRRRERKSDWWRRLFGMRDTNDRGNGPRGTLNADAAARWSLDRQVD